MLSFCGLKLPFKFESIVLRHDLKIFEHLEYLGEIFELYNKYIENLEDDFSAIRVSPQGLIDYIEKVSPHFYVILYHDIFCGFVCLDNLVGSETQIYSAEVVICLNRKFWGKSAVIIAQLFKYYCFDILKIKKLKAVIYPQNKLVRRLLCECGFKKEAVLAAETVKNGKLQNIELYSLFNTEKGDLNAI